MPSPWPWAPLGSSRDLLIGEWAIAIGNPFGFLLGNTEPSVTTGVISGTGRNLVGRAEGAGAYVDMIQTDAPINPGNSGGPLLDSSGSVIAINNAIIPHAQGIGFAVAGIAIGTVVALLAGKWVQLEPDVQLRDRYGRMLAYVWLPQRDGARVMVNAELLRRHGLAMKPDGKGHQKI